MGWAGSRLPKGGGDRDCPSAAGTLCGEAVTALGVTRPTPQDRRSEGVSGYRRWPRADSISTMPQLHHLAPALPAALLVLLPLSLVGAPALPLAHQAAHRLSPGGIRPGGSTARLTESGPKVVLSPPAGSAQKPTAAAPSPAPSKVGDFPYPMDAMGQVATGRLTLDVSGTGPGGQERLEVQIPAGGWAPGQRVFLYLGREYVTSAVLGGSAVIETTWTPGISLTGFQFPADNPSAPIDGYGSAPVPGPS